MNWDVMTGDCLEVMPTLPANSIDTIITDPPYGLSFMGKDWDHGVPGVPFWAEALRVAKPGAMLLAFGGSRTFHRLTCAIEDAGWEIRDCIMWVYGSGFPKSHDISKAIDRAAGAERDGGARLWTGGSRSSGIMGNNNGTIERTIYDNPATDAAREWHGWGTALKPAWEPVILAMKPLDGTFAENAQRWGVAGLNVDGGRIPTDDTGAREGGRRPSTHVGYQRPGATMYQDKTDWQLSPAGRWPANVIHDGSEEVVSGFPVTTGGGAQNGSRKWKGEGGKGGYGGWAGRVSPNRYISRDDGTGSAARFFYTAKASRSERNAGLEGMNGHPTIKPLALMRYLAKLTATPTGGVILDPFCGSGSTGCAAVLEGRDFIGIEQNEEYAEIARRRIAHWETQRQPEQLPLMGGSDV